MRTLIRHAFCVAATTVPLLTIAMIQPTLGAPLMTPVGCPMLPPPRMAAALSRAVLLPAIAAHANPKYRPAIPVAAKPQPENNFPVNRHPRLQAAFDNDCGSCQGKVNSGLPSLWHEGRLQRTPLLQQRGSFPNRLLPETPYNFRPSDDDRPMIAPAARMISTLSIPLYRQPFRKLRFQMIDDTLHLCLTTQPLEDPPERSGFVRHEAHETRLRLT
ncbi:MAG TPA: hypothetical protein VKB38_20935 [Terracidiphilus sp.]|nr:hypothetical protein [Terracidiphilus sp.]